MLRFTPLAILMLAACVPRAMTHAPLTASPVRGADSSYAHAVERGTRTWSGAPGARYWQQWAIYDLEATLDPGKARLTGRGTVRYVNHSPDTLRTLAVELYQNIHAMNAPRTEPMAVTGGVELTRVAAQGVELSPVGVESGAGYRVDGTIGWIRLPSPLAPGDTARLAFGWTFKVPPKGGPRMGQDGIVYFLGQWYPQMAVYDDVGGWQTDQYMGTGEFYQGFGDYDVRVTLPDGWLVAATGELMNPDSVLSERTRERLAESRRTGDIVHVVESGERGAGKATVRGADGKLTWHYRAQRVRDLAFGASKAYLWDATTIVIPDSAGGARRDTVRIDALYRPYRNTWTRAARDLAQSVEFLSNFLWAYPYDRMTVVEGLVSGGMEYPMLTLVGGQMDDDELFRVIVHETGHEWFPMQVSSDEKRYAWMDEGLTSFDEAEGVRAVLGHDDERTQQGEYLSYVGRGAERPMLVHADEYPDAASYTVATYDKPTAMMRALRGVLGDSTFQRAYREYGRRWQWKHPRPEDFWHTFADVSGRDLSWFWREWVMESWTLDQAIGAVHERGDSLEVVIENRDRAVMPVRLAVTREGGTVERREIPVDVWLGGARADTVRLEDGPRVTRIEIDPEALFSDVHRGNNRWSRD